MSHPRLRIAAARYALVVATTTELVEAADQALTDNVYSYSLGELGTLRNATWADASPLFRNALEELEIPMPSRDEAIQSLIAIQATAIAEGAIKPEDGLRALHEVYTTFQDSTWGRPDKVSLEPLRPFVDYHYSFETLREYAYLGEQGVIAYDPDPRAIDSLERECIQFAAEWCEKRWGPSFDPAWRTDTVLALARQMYESRDFSAMPILADALQDAGCDCDDILSHCREAHATHVRGCWVVDLVLGKE
jgi:hypothetical protein